jgi:4-amino-4-deoxy-L-arabinose transferase-like glycosyltransferase
MQKNFGAPAAIYVVFLILIGALLFFPFLGRVHLFDWDEINFAECSREMLATGDFTRVYIDYMPFWEKPPMFFWMQSAAMNLFGITEYAARFPNAVCGIITLVTVFLCGRKVYDRKLGLLWAMAYAGSLFPNMYFKSGIIDPWFNLFTFLSLYFFVLYHWKHNRFDVTSQLNKSEITYAFLSGLFMGLAILMKGQVALVMFILVLGVYLIYNRFKFFFSFIHVVMFLVVMLLVTASWFGYETFKNGPQFLTEFMTYQVRLLTTHDAGQKGFPGYHFVVILIGCFPASLFAIPAFFKNQYTSKTDKDFKVWMQILFWVVTILFTFVQSRIIHYSSLAWFPVTFLAAYTFYKWMSNDMKYRKYVNVLLILVGGLLALALLLVSVAAVNLQKIAPYVKDKFARANMEADVHWNGWESIVGILLILAIIMGIYHLNRRKYLSAALSFFGGTALVVFLASAIIVPKVEGYSQAAAIEFFEKRQGEDCYVQVLGYKSYAHLFYTKKQKPANLNSYDQDWLLTGAIDKPVYFVTKIDRYEKFQQYTELKELYRKNGFVFLKREVPKR